MRLEIGSGETPSLDYDIHCDVRPLPHIELVCAAQDLKLADDCVEAIKMNQFLEHISRDEATQLLRNCRKWLTPAGELLVYVPDVEWYAQQLVSGKYNFATFVHMVYGAQDYPDNTHRWGYSPASLKDLAVSLGYKIISCEHLDGSVVLKALAGK